MSRTKNGWAPPPPFSQQQQWEAPVSNGYRASLQNKRPWYKKKRWLVPLGLYVFVGMFGGGEEETGDTVASETRAPAVTDTAEPPGVEAARLAEAERQRDASAAKAKRGSAEPQPVDTATAPPVVTPVEADSGPQVVAACSDPTGDSTGALDLAGVTVTRKGADLLWEYRYSGSVPQVGSVLWSTLGGGKQFGYKLVDGREAAHFVWDSSRTKQTNLSAPADLGSNGHLEAHYPGSAKEDVRGAHAAISVDGMDVDECSLT